MTLDHNAVVQRILLLQSGTTLANYTYLADGTKVSALNESGDGFYYQGSLVYNKRGENLSLESTSFSGGRFVASIGGFVPRYFVTDHLGSVRMVVNESGSVLEINDYYPYGGRWETGDITDNRYRYNGKETQEFVGLPYTDYGARMYNGISWFAPDPLAEKYYSISPYAFCMDNPVNMLDPDGRLVIFVNGIHKGDGGNSSYWEGFDDVVMSHLNDYNKKYFDGALGGAVTFTAMGLICWKSSLYGFTNLTKWKADFSYAFQNIPSKKR